MTTPAPNSLARYLRAPGYLFFGLAMLLPVLDLMITVYPWHIGQVVWRFGAVGLLSSAVGAPLLVLFFIFALALFAGDRKVVVAVGIIAALIALLLISGAGSFSLDALQMKRRVQAAAQERFMMASMQAMLKLVLESITAIVLAFSALRTLKKARVVAAPRGEKRGSSSLVMGRPSSQRTSIPNAEVLPPASITSPTDE